MPSDTYDELATNAIYAHAKDSSAFAKTAEQEVGSTVNAQSGRRGCSWLCCKEVVDTFQRRVTGRATMGYINRQSTRTRPSEKRLLAWQ